MASRKEKLEAFLDQRAGIFDEPEETIEPQKISSQLDSFINSRVERAEKTSRGMGRALAQGVTFGFSDELEAALSEGKYSETIKEIRAEQKEFAEESPGISAGLEILGAIPTSLIGAGALARAGAKTISSQAAVEGAVYGVGSGDSFEDRVSGGITGALGGAVLGKVIDKVVTPSSTGGLRTEANDLADDALGVEDVAAAKAIEEAKATEKFTEVDNPVYARTPLSEAKTAGEFYEGVKGAFGRFYNDKVTGVSDELMRDVSPQIGARYQKADETALRTTNKELGNLAERLVPVIKIINDDTRAKGALLDFGANKIARKGATRKESIEALEKELSTTLNTEHMNTLKAYLNYSYGKNQQLNNKVFGGGFKDDGTYLHTRNRSKATAFKEEGLDEVQVENRMFKDSAQEARTRGSYLRKEDKAPDPLDYDNPIVSDMQRIFKMERLAQLQKEFNVDIENILAPRRAFAREGQVVYVTPEEFMDELFNSFIKRGISNDGAKYAVRKITDSVMGQQTAPHPLIQAANSAAYATTLAGPMSAILNIADIPLVGAKYGGAAVREGLQVLNPFKKIPDPDLKALGLDNQTFGEFVNKTNDLASDQMGFMARTAAAMRGSADFLMKGSGFAAIDRVGKKGVMRGVLQSATNDAKAGRLADNWGFYFNDAELKIIESQLKRHGTDWREYTGKGKELIEQLMFAGLGQQQLISAAGRPAAWARNPNLRPLWALRGFVVKQQALALREVMGNIKAGKPEEAAKFLGRYAAYGAGGYAIINEGRQFIFGDGEMSFNGLARGYGDAWASLLTANTLGLNDYQYGQIKQNGLLLTFAQGMEPLATSRARDIAGTVIDVLDEKRPVQAIAQEFPIYTNIARAGERAAEAVGATTTQGLLEEAMRKRNPES